MLNLTVPKLFDMINNCRPLPCQLSAYRTSRAAHICSGRSGTGWAEESRGRRDRQLYRETYSGPHSRPQLSSAEVRAVSLWLSSSVYNQACEGVSSSTAGCTGKPPCRTCRWTQTTARLWSTSSSARPPTDATRNCSRADGDAGRNCFLNCVNCTKY